MRLFENLPPVFRGCDAVEAGLLTPAQLRGPHVRRLFVGVYCPAQRQVDHLLRCHGVALLGEGKLVLTGRSAATVRGISLARDDDPVAVIVREGSRVNRRAGLDVRGVRMSERDHTPWNGIRIASATRTAFDVMTQGPLTLAVAGLDQLLHAGAVSELEMAAFLSGRHDDGIVRARTVLALADGRAESPPESVLRVVLAQAALCFVPQVVITHGGRFVARVDLGDPQLKLAVEYDGRWHADRTAFAQDRARLNHIHSAGWEVVSVTTEMLRTPTTVVAVVADAVTRRRRLLQLAGARRC